MPRRKAESASLSEPDRRVGALRNGLAALLVLVAATAVARAGRRGEGALPPAAEPPPCAVTEREAPRDAARALMCGDRLDFRKATLADLLLLDGIGPRRARALLAARRAGSLQHVSDADRMPGFGPALVWRLDRDLAFGGAPEDG